MEDKELILEAYQLISELNKAYQTCKQGLPYDLRLQQNEMVRSIRKIRKVPSTKLLFMPHNPFAR